MGNPSEETCCRPNQKLQITGAKIKLQAELSMTNLNNFQRRPLPHETEGLGDNERKAALLKYSNETGHIRVRIHKKQEAFECISHGPDGKGKIHIRAVIPGDNYCMDIVETPDGKWHGIAITRFEAHKPGWKDKWRRSLPHGKPKLKRPH